MLITAGVIGSLFLVVNKGTVRQVAPQSVYTQQFFHQRVEVCRWPTVTLCLCQKCTVIFGVIVCDAFESVVFAFHWCRICSLVESS